MNGVALVFPGQGSQKPGMGGDLARNFEAARRVFEEASDALHWDVLRLCTEGPLEELNRTERTQPALLTVSLAALRVLEAETDVRPSLVAGHSLGEITAVAAARGLPPAHAVRLVEMRGRFMQEAVPAGEGAMAAVLGLEAREVEEVCAEVEGVVVPANLNCPGQIVISGQAAAVEEASELARERGAKRVVLLDVSVPSHSPLMAPAAERLARVLEEMPLSDLAVPLVNNAGARVVQAATDVREGLVAQLTSPVRWEEGVRAMIARGVETFVEVGPGKVLSSLIQRIRREVRVLNLQDREGLEMLQKAAAAGEV